MNLSPTLSPRLYTLSKGENDPSMEVWIESMKKKKKCRTVKLNTLVDSIAIGLKDKKDLLINVICLLFSRLLHIYIAFTLTTVWFVIWLFLLRRYTFVNWKEMEYLNYLCVSWFILSSFHIKISLIFFTCFFPFPYHFLFSQQNRVTCSFQRKVSWSFHSKLLSNI